MTANRCLVCGAAAEQRCSGCKSAFYCCRDHQKQHWRQHKSQCCTVKVMQSPELGRYLVAARDLAPGEVVVRESALVEGPAPSTPPLCLGCYRLLEEHTARECSKCGWPLCGAMCEDAPMHQAECRLTVEKRGNKMKIRNFGIPHPSYQCMVVLRCLALRDSNPPAWRRLLELESHDAARRGSQRYEQERFGVAQFILRVFPKMADDFSEEEILNICGIVQVNGHEVPLSEPPHVAVYEKASLLAHSCRANCSKSFSANGALVVRTAGSIRAGETLTICYTDPMWGTAARRQHLHETKFFWCRCERCSDATEMGTFFSALTCPGDCDGAVLPEDPLAEGGSEEHPVDEDEDGGTLYWRCSTCDVSMPKGSVLSLLQRVGADLAELDKDDPEACRAFLRLYGGDNFPLDLQEKPCSRQPLLARSHFYLSDVRLALAQRYGQDSPDGLKSLTDGELAHKSILCRQMLQLADKLVPAENRMRGLLLFEMHAVEAEESRRRGLEQGPDPGALRASLLESRNYLVKSVDLLCHEPEALPEGKVLLQAKRNMADLDKLLQALHNAVGVSPM